jgi:preprotein translocase subunit SecA
MIEALRTSVSMEPGAQKDSLNVYKRWAAEMFDELVSDIRTAFVRNLFNFRLSKQSEAE